MAQCHGLWLSLLLLAVAQVSAQVNNFTLVLSPAVAVSPRSPFSPSVMGANLGACLRNVALCLCRRELWRGAGVWSGGSSVPTLGAQAVPRAIDPASERAPAPRFCTPRAATHQQCSRLCARA